MADYSGNSSGNATLSDGDTIGSSSSLVILAAHTYTGTAGATISVYATRSITVTGALNSTGTLLAPITFKSQAADPSYNNWSSITAGSSTSNLTLVYTKINNSAGVVLSHASATVNINKLFIDRCTNGIAVSAPTGNWTIQNAYVRYAVTTAFSSANNNSACTLAFNRCWAEGCGYGFFFSRPNGETVNNSVSIQNSRAFMPQPYGSSTSATLAGCYIRGGGASQVTFFPSSDSCTLNISDVIATAAAGFNAFASAPNMTLNSSYNDFVDLYGSNTLCYAAGGTTNSDYDYVAGWNGRPVDLVDVGAGTQIGALTSRTNIQSTPNHPLTIDNVSEGAAGITSITITFDCAASATTSKRSWGLPFIRYGTVSGVYTMETFIPSPENFPLYWISWKTDLVYKQTGHSVALGGLTPGTKYYYVCGAVDPLGRELLSSEGDFTTSTTSLTFSVKQSDNYAPATYTTNITLSATVAGASHVTCTINGVTKILPNIGGNNYSLTTYCGVFGQCTGATLYFEASDLGGSYGTNTATSTITIPAISATTTALISAMNLTLTGVGVVTLANETGLTPSIQSTMKIVFSGGTSTLDNIRTLVNSNYDTTPGNWGCSAYKEVGVKPVGTPTEVYFRMTHA